MSFQPSPTSHHTHEEPAMSIATRLEQLGLRDRACAVAKMTLVLHPDLGDDRLANDFARIRSRTCTEETSP